MRFYELEQAIHDENDNVIRRKLDILVRQDEHHVKGKRLGRHIEHDPLSRMFSAHDKVDLSIESVLWTPGNVLDQGELGSCTGNAMGGAIACMTGKPITENECIELYKLATHHDRIPGEYPPDDTGSSGLAVCKAAKEMGYINAYHHAFSMRAALKALQTGPVITGFGWYDSFDEPDNTGYIEIKEGAVIRGGHEVFAYGLHIETTSESHIDEDLSMVLMQNSWGKDYGQDGSFQMSVATWRRLMKEYGDVTVPVLHL